MRIRCRVRMGSPPPAFGPVHARRFAAAVCRSGGSCTPRTRPGGQGRVIPGLLRPIRRVPGAPERVRRGPMIRNVDRTVCYHFATQFGSTGQYRTAQSRLPNRIFPDNSTPARTERNRAGRLLQNCWLCRFMALHFLSCSAAKSDTLGALRTCRWPGGGSGTRAYGTELA